MSSTSVNKLYSPVLHELSRDTLIRALANDQPAFVALENAPGERSLGQYLRGKMEAKNFVWGSQKCGVSVPPSTVVDMSDVSSFRTAACENFRPPRIVAFANNTSAVDTQLFTCRLIRVRHVVEKLDICSRHVLRTVRIKWRVANRDDDMPAESVLSPVLFSDSRARFDIGSMFTDHLAQPQLDDFNKAFGAFCRQICLEASQNKVVIAAPCLLMFDNHSFLHSISPGGIDQVGFDLPFVPELYRSLDAAIRHPLFEKYFTYCPPGTAERIKANPFQFHNWPLLHKSKYVESMHAVFRSDFFGKGSLYWSPSGGSTSSSTSRVALPTASSEMHIMRKNLSELYMDKGLINSQTVCVNLLCSDNLSTGMEVQCEVLRWAEATHLGVGPNVSDETICNIIDQYGANMLVGMGSYMIQLAIYCLRNGRRLPTVTRILHGGENFNPGVTQKFSNVFNEDVRTYGVYGSSEAGIFALKPPEEKYYETMPDSVHLEVVDSEGKEVPTGQAGTLVVTNILRQIHPQVRYFTGDLARFPSQERNKFDLLGRNLASVQRAFGSKKVCWVDVATSVGELFEKYFGGLCLYQMWVSTKPNETMNVTLALYANTVSKAVEAQIVKEAVKHLWKVFSADTNVTGIRVKIVDESEDMARFAFSNKLKYFVDKV
ncbi:Capsular polysaccharide biosynthesis protein CapK [Gracilaria domingensis]|nr:Capsular polysaccharide biosynthesis protein CapK [Gracilaria domingensis]